MHVKWRDIAKPDYWLDYSRLQTPVRIKTEYVPKVIYSDLALAVGVVV